GALCPQPVGAPVAVRMACVRVPGSSRPSGGEGSAPGSSFPISRDIEPLTGRLRAGGKIAREYHDRVAVGVAGAILAVLRVDVDRARAGELALRTADELLRRHIPAVGPVPSGDGPGRVVPELLDEPAIGDHHLVALGVELDLPRPQHARIGAA